MKFTVLSTRGHRVNLALGPPLSPTPANHPQHKDLTHNPNVKFVARVRPGRRRLWLDRWVLEVEDERTPTTLGHSREIGQFGEGYA